MRCSHCWLAPPHDENGKTQPVLDPELFRSIVRQAKEFGLKGVKLTGGEPFLHPEINTILDYIREECLELTVETNGVLCTPELALKLKECSNQLSIAVSLDGADALTHETIRGVKGAFPKAVRGIRNLVQSGINPQIIMTVMRRNVSQIESLVRLAEELGAGSVKFNMLQPTERGKAIHENGESLNVRELIELGAVVENNIAPSTSIKLYYDHPVAFRPLGRIFGKKEGISTCGIMSILGVLADGSYALCGIGDNIKEFVFGHAATNRFSDVWQNNPVLKNIREGMPVKLEGVCERCIFKSHCLGSCIAQNYYATRNLWAPFWFCKSAFEAGLFPESRLTPLESTINSTF
ncbi:MAG: SynChlorMet cassette radical SAM/SPASM protein ScmF [Chlorobium sp.]|nr:MAG: SynChlorMet cassette radical SAM/SPASM protein ScmF [Chlorobium sp.]